MCHSVVVAIMSFFKTMILYDFFSVFFTIVGSERRRTPRISCRKYWGSFLSLPTPSLSLHLTLEFRTESIFTSAE